MKKIGTYDWAIGIGSAIKEVIPTAYTHGVDIYKEDDGSVRIFPHKISFEEAEALAGHWLVRNNAYCFSSSLSYSTPFKDIVLCTYRFHNEIKIGMAKFNKKDIRSSYIIGKALAYSRASGKKLPDDLAAYLGVNQ